MSLKEEKFGAMLSSHNEVPPFYSDAKGTAEFTVTAEYIEFSVDATNIQGVTAGHIHSGKQGEIGPIVATLFKNSFPTNGVSEKGLGHIYGTQLTDLVTAMNNGETYVNINTEQNPDGEIRGQILSSTKVNNLTETTLI